MINNKISDYKNSKSNISVHSLCRSTPKICISTKSYPMDSILHSSIFRLYYQNMNIYIDVLLKGNH